MPIDYHLYSKHLNIFLDEAKLFHDEYADCPPMHSIAKKITDLLLADRDLPFTHTMHPFNRFYALAPIAEVIQEQVMERELRPYVVSFFHSGGANHDNLCDFLDKFWDWAEYSDPEYDNSSTDSEDEQSQGTEEEAVIDLTASEAQQPVGQDDHVSITSAQPQQPQQPHPLLPTNTGDRGLYSTWGSARRALDFTAAEDMPAFPPQLVRT